MFSSNISLRRSATDAPHLDLSDWEGAPIEAVSGDDREALATGGSSTGSSSRSGSGGDEPPSETAPVAVPEMNLDAVYNSIITRAGENGAGGGGDGGGIDGGADCDVSSVGNQAEVSANPPSLRNRHPSRGVQRPSINYSGQSLRVPSKLWMSHSFRPSSTKDNAVTIAPSSSASRTSYSSSAGTNIWTKLLGGGNAEGLWDGLDGKGDVFDDSDELLDDDNDLDCDDQGGRRKCDAFQKSMKRRGLGWWYETKHFFKTIVEHPHIAVVSLAAFGILCGVGMAAINAEKGTYERKQQMTVEFIARETGEWFANEFRKAMLPLYSIQQGVVHSGYFNEAFDKIGDYPNLVIPETDYLAAKNPDEKEAILNATQGKILRNLTGICDDPDLQQKWTDIVSPINADNGLDDGSVFAYRLAPRNVFCLYERADPTSPDKSYGFDAGVSSENAFWKTTVTDVFGIDDVEKTHKPGMSKGQVYSIYGPFGMPDKEWFCGHLPVYQRRQSSSTELFDSSGETSSSLNVHGTEVEGAWGFVMNYIDWRLLKDKSDIYERFEGCGVEFRLVRQEDGVLLAESPQADLLTEENSIVIETSSLHGVWENRVGRIDGWSPPWYPYAVAGVVLASIILGFLTASTLVERQLHRNLVTKMLPPRAIAKLHRGQTVLDKYNLVTIFFSDIVGFTSMAGQMRPIQVMKMLNELYMELDKLVEKHKVYKVETIGDAYMVVGGAPNRVPAPLAAERVAMFALDAIGFVRDFRTKDGDRVFIRAGLASGPTVAGVVGKAMPRYCFFGDTVNFASRMESTSKKMRVQVAEITSRLLRDAPNVEFEMVKRMEGDVAGVQVKGKGHLITYWVEKHRPRDSSQKVVPHPLPSKLSEVEEVTDDVEGGETNVESGHEEFLKIVSSGSLPEQVSRAGEELSEPKDISMYTPSETHEAMTAQDWKMLGHAENALVAATDDCQKMIVRASAILEYHLLRVVKDRDGPEAGISEEVREQICKFVKNVAATYGNVHFHSLSHAMQVMTSMNKLLSATLKEDPLNTFFLVFSAFLHDAGHTGMSNKILSDIHHPLAENYEEGVPLAERHSIDIALKLLFCPEYEGLRLAIIPCVLDKIQFAKTLFQGILVTDIASPASVKLCLERYEVSQDEHDKYDAGLCPLVPYLDSVLDGVGLDESAKDGFPTEFVITHRGLQNCVRNEHLMLLSDVGHLLQGWENFVKWNFRLYKELHDCFKKGLCDDPRVGWFQGQIGFLSHYVLPLAKRSKMYFNKEFGDALVENGLENLKLWTKYGVKATDIMVSSVDEGQDENTVLMHLYEFHVCDDETDTQV